MAISGFPTSLNTGQMTGSKMRLRRDVNRMAAPVGLKQGLMRMFSGMVPGP